MSKSNSQHQVGSSTGSGSHKSLATRIDPAHPITSTPSERSDAVHGEGVENVKSPPDHSASMAAVQVHAQAAQLADHLRSRQHELDHREGRLNSQIANAEAEARNARLLLGQHQAELQEEEQEFQKRLARLAAAETSFEQERQQADSQWSQREQALDHRERQLDELAERLDAETAELDKRARQPSDALLAREHQVLQRSEELDQRHQRIKEADTALARTQAETDQFHAALVRDRKRLEERIHAENQRTAAENQRCSADFEQQRRELAQRAEHVDQCQASLKQLRAELGQIHQETLELRLATEEIWVQLSGSAPPAALTQSLGRIRAKLAEGYRVAHAELGEQKRELLEIRRELVGQHRKLVDQKHNLGEWASQSREEIECQAKRLRARERDLERQQAELNEQIHQWRSRELGYQQEIRQLQAKLEASGTTRAAA